MRKTCKQMEPLVMRRMAANLSQTDVAISLGTNTATISRLETGATSHSPLLEPYAAMFGLRPVYIFIPFEDDRVQETPDFDLSPFTE